MKANEIQVKSTAFEKRIIKAYQYLTNNKQEFILSKQLFRCGTSIGANVTEAQYGSSRKDFLNKLHIALKECAETLYWLDFSHPAIIWQMQNIDPFTMTARNFAGFFPLSQNPFVKQIKPLKTLTTVPNS